eukprot:TRINITY_DN4785_c0_g1_i1.p1 TRINITY_DN4785_c0_g1~~TRINITY_DN4785_c0_g1_i1.p1  ORF type:complete len:378 (+),score=86.55 TRINITY_DN4785_c0_g1_i1:94-1227(+)
MPTRCRMFSSVMRHMKHSSAVRPHPSLLKTGTQIAPLGDRAMHADASAAVVTAGVMAAGAGVWFMLRQSPQPVTLELLKKQDATTSAAIIAAFKSDKNFKKYSVQVTAEIIGRDVEDEKKLQKGIDMAIGKKVLPAKVDVEKVMVIRVDSKSPEAVANQIISALGHAPSKGCVLTLQGWSGTGKGTTVAKLAETLPKTATWSNGNIFRSLTLLAVTYSEQKGCDLKDALTPELLASFMGMLEFGEFNGKFDTKIEGLGMRYLVSDIQNTKLKAISKFIPTVAEVSQGEVVNFVQGALQKMSSAGFNVLVEGREQTLNYIRSPHRFELVLKDSNLIGMRRAAQVLGGEALELLKGKPGADDAAVQVALQDALSKLTTK